MSHFADDETPTNIAYLDAEVLRLRNALETFIAEHEECEDSDGWMAQMCSMEALHVAGEVLSTPFIHTALNELIEKVEKMTIERCAKAVWNSKPSQKAIDEIPAAYQLASLAAIRVLPTDQIKLEELL